MKDTRRFCPALWFSGFFGLAALVHLTRLLLRVPVTVAAVAIPMQVSVWVAGVAGALSVGLAVAGMKRPCCPDSDKKCHSA